MSYHVTHTQLVKRLMRTPDLAAHVVDPDEWATLTAALSRATAAMSALGERMPAAAANPTKSVDAALREGTELPENFGASRADYDARVAALNTERDILQSLRVRYADELEQLVTESLPELVTALDAELQRVLDTAAERLDKLGGSVDPAEAIKAKRVKEFEEFTAAHADYLEVMQKAAAVVRHEDGPVHILHFRIPGLARVWPAWKDSETRDVGVGFRRTDGPGFSRDADSAEFFAWLVDNRTAAAPRVMRAEELRALHARDAKAAAESHFEQHANPRQMTHGRTEASLQESRFGEGASSGAGTIVRHGFERPQ